MTTEEIGIPDNGSSFESFLDPDDGNGSSSFLPHAPPQFQASDYGEIILLSILIMVGGPLNLASLFRTLRAAGYFDPLFPNGSVKFPMTQSISIRRRPVNILSRNSNISSGNGKTEPVLHHRRGVKANPRLLTFKLHLTSANLLIVFGYGFSQLIWLCTYSWEGGDILCKFTKFLHTFCFYATANLVASIAIDRLHVIMNVDRPATNASINASQVSHAVWLQRLLWSAWLLAFASSVPQFFLWKTYAPSPHAPNWQQCVTVWFAAYSDSNSFFTVAYYEKIYGAVHLALVFWIPASIIALCYALILAQLHMHRVESMHRASICSGASHSDTGNSKAKRRTTKKTAWILLAYVACWSPYNILELYRYYFDPDFENVYLQFLSNLIVFNAVVNPLIYGL